jgi:hypothetical protein
VTNVIVVLLSVSAIAELFGTVTIAVNYAKGTNCPRDRGGYANDLERR